MRPRTMLVAGSSLLAVALVAADRPDPPAASERADERARMVEQQMAHPPDGRMRVPDERVLEAMRAAPRHVFVTEGSAHAA